MGCYVIDRRRDTVVRPCLPGGSHVATLRRRIDVAHSITISRITGISGLALLMAFATPVAAQHPTTQGFIFGLHVGAVSIQAEDVDRATGGGGGLYVGYGLNPRVTIFTRVDGANIAVENAFDVEGAWGMGHVDLGVRVHFPGAERSAVPYLEGSLTGRLVDVSELSESSSFGVDEISFSGGALSLGGGVMVYATQTLAIDLGLLVSTGGFSDPTLQDAIQKGLDLNTTSTRLNIGVRWWL